MQFSGLRRVTLTASAGVGTPRFHGVSWWAAQLFTHVKRTLAALTVVLLVACGDHDEPWQPIDVPGAGPAEPHAFTLPLTVYVSGALSYETARAFRKATTVLEGAGESHGVFGRTVWSDKPALRRPCDCVDVVPGDALVIRLDGCRYVVEFPVDGLAEQGLWHVAAELGVGLGGDQ